MIVHVFFPNMCNCDDIASDLLDNLKAMMNIIGVLKYIRLECDL